MCPNSASIPLLMPHDCRPMRVIANACWHVTITLENKMCLWLTLAAVGLQCVSKDTTIC